MSSTLAANLLTNPGFESGQTGWANPNPIYGGASVVINDPALAHSGNSCISNYNAGGISGPEQGDSAGGWSSGVSLPISSANFYRLSAYVKVPGASTNPQPITLRYRFEPSTTRNDVGTKTINTENWTLVQSGWLSPAAGDYFESYWMVHSINNGVMFYADDCALEEATPLTLQGRVVTNGVGVDGANVRAVSADYSTTTTTTSGGGYYTLAVPPGTYFIGANVPGLLGSTNATVSSDPTTAGDIVLSTDPDYDPDLILFARSSAFNAGAPWATAFPAGGALSLINNPGVKSFGGVKWENNDAVNNTGFLLGTYDTSIPANGASVVLVAKRKPSIASDNWDSIVDVFYDRLVLGIRNDTGVVNVRRNGSLDYSTTSIPVGQTTVLSLVVQPDGTYKVWANGVSIMTNTNTSDMSALVPMVPGPFANAINVGRNNPDTWTTFNGYVGDVYIYHTALDATKRQALEASLMNKFVTNATLSYTIVSSADANGSINPAGTNIVVQGNDQTYTITANAGYVVSDVLVDGTSVGAKTSYTFTDVSTNHTIAASFISLPPQTITATAGANGTISPTGAVSVAPGNNQSFAMIPDVGYAVADVLVDGVSQGEIYNYTFNFVTAPHTISVTFRALSMPVPRTEQLVFGAVSSVLPGDAITITNWPAYVPANKTLVTIGSPTSTLINGPVATNIWENNNSGTSDGYRYPGGAGGGGEYLSPIPCAGATIVAVAAPNTTYSDTGPWTSIVDVFYDQLVLGIRNLDGTVVARVKGGGAVYSTDVIPVGQPTVLTMVVQPDGSYKVWANTALMLSGTSGTFTNLTPGANTFQHYINVGRNNPDGWTAFNGNIGDVFLYKTALTDGERQQLEATLMAKFGAPLPPKYAWKGSNNGNWSNPANWNDSVPGVGNLATFSDTNTAGATVQLDTAITVKGIEFNNLVPNTTIASTLGNTLTLDDGKSTYNTRAPILVDGGAHTISAAVDAWAGIELTGPGKLTISGTTSIGTYSVVNPALVVSGGGELELDGASTLTFTRGALVQGGGKLTITGAFTSQDADQIIGDNDTTGEVVLSGSGSWTHSGS
ncbi:MAG TPA: hypothetical protein VFV96_10455, partial [Verrucomicrobiae bacterium]|nr:hypothetical protein [Verrucomicrobiae bacterium]